MLLNEGGDRLTQDAVMLTLMCKQSGPNAGFLCRLGRHEHLAADYTETNKNGFGRIAISSLRRRYEPVDHSHFGPIASTTAMSGCVGRACPALAAKRAISRSFTLLSLSSCWILLLVVCARTQIQFEAAFGVPRADALPN